MIFSVVTGNDVSVSAIRNDLPSTGFTESKTGYKEVRTHGHTPHVSPTGISTNSYFSPKSCYASSNAYVNKPGSQPWSHVPPLFTRNATAQQSQQVIGSHPPQAQTETTNNGSILLICNELPKGIIELRDRYAEMKANEMMKDYGENLL